MQIVYARQVCAGSHIASCVSIIAVWYRFKVHSYHTLTDTREVVPENW
jgi:hypothetical protein